MIYSISHVTEYKYDDLVSYCHNFTTLKPRSFEGQEVIESKMTVIPEPDDFTDRLDFFGNNVSSFSIDQPHKILTVACKSRIQKYLTDTKNVLEAYKNITLGQALEKLSQTEDDILNARQYILDSPLIKNINDEIKNYAILSFQDNRSIYDAAHELMSRIFNDFEYVPGFTDVATPLETAFQDKKGVCQDFAQIAIACIRSVGLAARYVSGYLETIPPEGQQKLVGADASHAWFSVFIPGFGWIDLDPTNNIIPEDKHITVAWGRDYYDLPPLKGVIYTNGKNTMKVSVDVSRED